MGLVAKMATILPRALLKIPPRRPVNQNARPNAMPQPPGLEATGQERPEGSSLVAAPSALSPRVLAHAIDDASQCRRACPPARHAVRSIIPRSARHPGRAWPRLRRGGPARGPGASPATGPAFRRYSGGPWSPMLDRYITTVEHGPPAAPARSQEP